MDRDRKCERAYLSSGIDYVQIEFLPLVLDHLLERILDRRVIRVDKVRIDKLHGQRGFTCENKVEAKAGGSVPDPSPRVCRCWPPFVVSITAYEITPAQHSSISRGMRRPSSLPSNTGIWWSFYSRRSLRSPSYAVHAHITHSVRSMARPPPPLRHRTAHSDSRPSPWI